MLIYCSVCLFAGRLEDCCVEGLSWIWRGVQRHLESFHKVLFQHHRTVFLTPYCTNSAMSVLWALLTKSDQYAIFPVSAIKVTHRKVFLLNYTPRFCHVVLCQTTTCCSRVSSTLWKVFLHFPCTKLLAYALQCDAHIEKWRCDFGGQLLGGHTGQNQTQSRDKHAWQLLQSQLHNMCLGKRAKEISNNRDDVMEAISHI